jgi:uncharacterized membrane protein
MNSSRSLWLLLPKQVRELPADLTAIAVLVAVTNVAVFTPVIRETPVRVPVGLAFVLFAPGYAFIAALFPERGETPAAEQADDAEVPSQSGIDGIERVALSFGLSIALVPLIGLVLNFTPFGIRLVPILVSVSGFTLGTVAVGAYRRRQLPPDDRFRVPYRAWIQAGRRELFEPPSRVDAALNIVLMASIMLAMGSVAYAVMVPSEGEQFSELYILTEDDDGELVASGYPTEFTRGESKKVVLGVENNEHRTTNYSTVVVEQDVSLQGNDSVIREQRELRRFETRLSHNETWQRTHEIAPTIVGNETRVLWLLYLGDDVPADPQRETADYTVQLWVTVDPS